jgi:DNA-directed RNA polymerase subunit L
MLPINVLPNEADVIRDTKLELRIVAPLDKPQEITSDDIVVSGPRKDIILKDRDLSTPLVFMNLKAGEVIHFRAEITLENKNVSQVCVSTFMNHINQEILKDAKETYVNNGGIGAVFDNYEKQRHFSVDEKGRPNHFDFAIESIGVMKSKDILRVAANILKEKIEEYAKTDILRHEDRWFSLESETEGHTIGYLAQTLIYEGGLVEYVSYNIPHPLLPKMVLRFQTTKSVEPSAVIGRFKEQAVALCESILKSL